MPEGPEVRRYADALHAALTGRVIVSLQARTKEARKWLLESEQRITGRRVERVISHGKHLIGYIEGRFFFHSHLMMWGRWQTFSEPPEKDRRERARIVVDGAAAILLSAPIFNVGEGDPYEIIEFLDTLGPDALPYRGPFNRAEFLRRLLEYKNETIGAALLNQRIVAGLGNYLRAEILFHCKLNPWLTAGELNERHLTCLSKTIPRLARDAYKRSATAGEKDRNRMATDPSLVYQPGREIGTRHLVFRRTNLPCLRCGQKIRQLRQRTIQTEEEDEERTRIVYFCAKCQGVQVEK
ncbi:MAG TPA: DNA-formamidopyrimidine glycosylase family protein [Pyrinomonadaceae bacterium]|nr:DNA-formamidopyrimidine glycosylase family protein [Pyrinomonadaceae bacterium]